MERNFADPCFKTNEGEQGAPISISSNFDLSGLVWVVFPEALDSNHSNIGTGRLLVYDASNANSSGNLPLLYSHDLLGDRILKFTPPMVANGKVFLATQGQPTVASPIAPRVLVYWQ